MWEKNFLSTSNAPTKAIPKSPSIGKTTIALVSILLLASFFRFYNITEKGIFFHDEAAYMLEGRFLNSSLHFMIDLLFGKVQLSQAAERIQGFPMNSGHPTHTIFIFLTSLIVGTEDYMAFLTSAIFGILSVYLTYRLGTVMFNERVGLFSAILLALSAYHVYYSRSGFPETEAGFFVLLPTYLYYIYKKEKKENNRSLFYIGLLIGIGFTVKYRCFFVPIIFWFLEVRDYLADQKFTNYVKTRSIEFYPGFISRVKNFTALSLGMASPLVFYIVVTAMGKAMLSGIYPCHSYLDQLIRIYGFKPGLVFLQYSTLEPFIYLSYFRQMDGWLWCVLFLIGSALAAIRYYKTRELGYLILLLYGPGQAIYWGMFNAVITDFYLPRAGSMCIIFAALCGGLGMDYILSRSALISWKIETKYLTVVLLSVILSIGSYNSFQVAKLKSSFKEVVFRVCQYIVNENKGPIYITKIEHHCLFPIWKFYAEMASAKMNVPLKRVMTTDEGEADKSFVLVHPSVYRYSAEYRKYLNDLTHKQSPISTGRLDWTKWKVMMIEFGSIGPGNFQDYDKGIYDFASSISVYEVTN